MVDFGSAMANNEVITQLSAYKTCTTSCGNLCTGLSAIPKCAAVSVWWEIMGISCKINAHCIRLWAQLSWNHSDFD